MPIHVVFLEPGFPANQREFVRALRQVGALVTGIGTAPLHSYDGELQSWMHGYEQVASTASVAGPITCRTPAQSFMVISCASNAAEWHGADPGGSAAV